MTTSSPDPEVSPSRSAETVRDHLLRFLRLVAKDVVRRLADADADDAERVKAPKVSRQDP